MLTVLGAVVTLVVAVRRAPWRLLFDNERSHVWWGSVATVAIVWAMRPAFGAGIGLHFIGATALFLMFGAPLAYVGIAIAGGLAAFFGATTWEHLAAELLIAGGLAIGVSWLVLRLVERFLPAQVFVFIFVAAFAAAGCASFVADAALWATTADLASHGLDGTALAAVALLLAFGEATLTGMIVALFVAFRPRWLASFDDARYLGRDRGAGT